MTLLAFVVAFAVNADRLQGVGRAALSAISDSQWIAYQTELELSRTLTAADRYGAGLDQVTRDDLQRRLDLLWSRLPMMVEGDQSEPLRAHTDAAAVVARLRSGLEEIDRGLAAGLDGAALRRLVHASLEPLSEPLHRVVLQIVHATSSTQEDLQRRVGMLSENHFIALAGILGTTSVLMLMLASEARRTRALLASANVAHERVAYIAHHDSLTGLPNRRLFQDRLTMAVAGARRRGGSVALHLIDVDRFKQVNDAFGHAGGDQLLTELGRRLRQCIRESDTLARIGGDELAVLQTDIAEPGSAAILAERLLAAARDPLDLDGKAIVPSISIGVALAPDDGADRDTLLRNADMALYEAKFDGRTRYRLYRPGMRRQSASLQEAAQRPIWMRHSGPDEMPKVLAKSP